jgi:microsomal dipeptidase-like Zn-dependent dipeptidase
MFHGPFVVKGEPATRGHVVAQARHLVETLGAEHVGLGSDWDGKIQSPLDLTGAPDLPALVADLRRALPPEAASAVTGGSFLRFWGAVRAAARADDSAE